MEDIISPSCLSDINLTHVHANSPDAYYSACMPQGQRSFNFISLISDIVGNIAVTWVCLMYVVIVCVSAGRYFHWSATKKTHSSSTLSLSKEQSAHIHPPTGQHYVLIHDFTAFKLDIVYENSYFCESCDECLPVEFSLCSFFTLRQKLIPKKLRVWVTYDWVWKSILIIR